MKQTRGKQRPDKRRGKEESIINTSRTLEEEEKEGIKTESQKIRRMEKIKSGR